MEPGTLTFFAKIMAIAFLALLALPVALYIMRSGRTKSYTRGRVRKVWRGWQEFRVFSVSSVHEAQGLRRFLEDRYNLETVEQDLEPDEESWVLEGIEGRIELHFNDHDGARIRASIRSDGRDLFQRLQRDFKKRRSWFF